MKTSKKIIVTSLVLAVMASSPLNSNVNAKPNSINLKIKSGWVQENGNWYYYNDSNVMVKNKWIGDYYLGKDGVMLVNTTTPDGYRVDRKGKWINGEWITNSTGKWFKYYNGGYPYSRWLEIDAQWYYFDSSGYAVKNQWVGNYYLGKDSVMLVNTTTPDGYKVDKNGKLIDEGEIIKEYDVIRFKYKNGKFAINKWVKVNSDWYYFDGSSKAKVLAWVGDYYLGEDGKMLKSTVTPDGYTVDENGKWDGNRSIGTVEKFKFENTKEFKSLVNQGLSKKQAELYLLINEYRVEKGLKKLSLSKSLTKVAVTHVKDSNDNHPENLIDKASGQKGNLHSWSISDKWTGMAYTPDHKWKEYMWNKPKELTAYKGKGYEISYQNLGKATPKGALNGWKGSVLHNNVIIGVGDWKDLATMGVGIDGQYAHVWFGFDEDPNGYYELEGYETKKPDDKLSTRIKQLVESKRSKLDILATLKAEDFGIDEPKEKLESMNINFKEIALKRANELKKSGKDKSTIMVELSSAHFTDEEVLYAVSNSNVEKYSKISEQIKDILDGTPHSKKYVVDTISSLHNYKKEDIEETISDLNIDFNEEAKKFAKKYLDEKKYTKDQVRKLLKSEGFTDLEIAYADVFVLNKN